MMKDFLLSYDTVCLRPKYSCLKSRSDANTSMEFLGKTFRLPIIPANMLDTISYDNAKWLSENDYFYIFHRFNGETKKFLRRSNAEKLKIISISVGTTDYKDIIDFSISEAFRIDYFTIDVAHGFHENVKPTIKYIKEKYPESKLIVGNVATAEAFQYLIYLGANAIKVGIGGGSICSTKIQTGFHLPTLHSVYECANLGLEIPIIADGGAKYYGDIAKALTFGAACVMSGSWFASCLDSPAKIINGKKFYRGSTSYEAKGEKRHIEGITLELEEGVTYEERMEEISQALKSAISYGGGNNLEAFKSVQWERILPYH